MTSPTSAQPGYVVPARYWAWLGTPRAVAALVWVAAFACGIAFTHRALHWFDNPPHLPPDRQRADGNSGHTQIDFGGQWLMGRMLATGHGRELYHRQVQRQVLRAGYLAADEAPIQRDQGGLPRFAQTGILPGEDWHHDYANLMTWFMGSDPPEAWKTVGGAAVVPLAQPPTGNPFIAIALEQAAADKVTPEVVAAVNRPAVGGPLYPPVHALFYAPLGLIDRPQRAYHVFQMFCVLLIPVCGLGVKMLSRGRIWWSVATLCIFLYPGLRGALDLGQNPVISLCIVVWGWALASRGYNVAGGMVWGLFAFKPVWAAAFFLVPLLMRRWRFCAAMVLTAAAFGLLTLPFVGLESWFQWLKIGEEATELYKVNDNWIHLSRDLQGIPRRVLHDFTKMEHERETPLANALAWGLLGTVFVTTVLVYTLRADRTRPTGVAAGFLFLGAYLTCFHFMYYDVLISAVALAVLFANPKESLRARVFEVNAVQVEPQLPAERGLHPPPSPPKPLGGRMLGYVNSFPLTVVMALFVMENSLSGMELEATVGIRYYATPATDGGTNARVPRLKADTGLHYPTDTFLLLTLWAWCGWQLCFTRPRESPRVAHAIAC